MKTQFKLILLTLFIFVSGLNIQAQNRKAMFFKKSGSFYLFDIYSNALFGYSLQRLKTGQTYGVRVERSSDNVQTDVELYDSGSIDMSSTVSAGGDLSTWIGSNTAYVVTWYDQSGNDYDLTGTIAAKTGKLVITGTLQTHNGNTSINLTSSEPGVMTRSAITELNSGNNFTIFSATANLSSLLGVVMATSSGSSRMQLAHNRQSSKRGSYVLASTNAFADLDIQYNDSSTWIQTSFVDGVSKEISHWKDGTAGGQNQAWTGSYTNDTLTINSGPAGNFGNGRFFEIVAFSDDKTGSRTAIETHIDDRYL